jgi:hypothetical protein
MKKTSRLKFVLSWLRMGLFPLALLWVYTSGSWKWVAQDLYFKTVVVVILFGLLLIVCKLDSFLKQRGEKGFLPEEEPDEEDSGADPPQSTH